MQEYISETFSDFLTKPLANGRLNKLALCLNISKFGYPVTLRRTYLLYFTNKRMLVRVVLLFFILHFGFKSSAQSTFGGPPPPSFSTHQPQQLPSQQYNSSTNLYPKPQQYPNTPAGAATQRNVAPIASPHHVNTQRGLPNDPELNCYSDPLNARKDPAIAPALKSIYAELKQMEHQVSYEMPSNMGAAGTALFKTAAGELNAMLEGKTKPNIKRAVFLVENASLNGQLNYEKFNSDILQLKAFCLAWMVENQIDPKNDFEANYALYRFFSDTLSLKSGRKHFPYQYDFEDYEGRIDRTKLFVSKLIKTGSGQCHSLPLLYRILAEELKIKAWIALSPNHLYIKFPNSKGSLTNIELTSGYLSTDKFIIGSGYVTVDAIRRGAYLDTLSLKHTIAFCLRDLVYEYAQIYGYDRFCMEQIDKVLGYYPQSIDALLIKSDCVTSWFQMVWAQLGKPSVQEAQAKYPELLKINRSMLKVYELVDNSGYMQMPEAAYRNWLSSIKNEQNAREHRALKAQHTTHK